MAHISPIERHVSPFTPWPKTIGQYFLIKLHNAFRFTPRFLWGKRRTFVGWSIIALGFLYLVGVCAWGPHTTAPPFAVEYGFWALTVACLVAIPRAVIRGQWTLGSIATGIAFMSAYVAMLLPRLMFVLP